VFVWCLVCRRLFGGFFMGIVFKPPSFNMASSSMGFGSALEKLKQAANLEPARKVVPLSDGFTELEMYITPLVAAERDRARRNARAASKTKDDDSDWLIHLLVAKAKNSDGSAMFAAGEIPELKASVRAEDLDKMILVVLGSEDDEVDASTKKSQTNSAKTVGPT
jgi:hypothetical protein